ncbi:MAG TPA: cbb3-type cytochrome c oxidase subunit I, partial [Bacillota bacterium]
MAKPAAAAHAAHEHHDHEPRSFWSKYVFSLDHKVIAIQYTVTALLVGMVGLVMSWLIRLQLGFPGSFEFIAPTNYYQFMTYHGLIMIVYLLTALLLGGFGNYLIPLMIGARDMAYPTLNMLSYWTYLASVIVLMLGYLVPGGPTGATWMLYPPQSITGGTPGSDLGIIVLLVSIVLFVISATMGGLNYITTVLQMRTRGLTLMRMPLTVWGVFVAAVVALLSFPALFVSGVMLLFDKALGTSFFMPAISSLGTVLPHEGGSPLLYQHLFWFFGHPEVYVVILPAMGVVSDVMAAHARKPVFGYKSMVISQVAIGFISCIVWAHHMFTSGMNPSFGFIFAATTVIVAIPSAIKVYNWLLTLWRGSIRFTTPMLFAIG